MIKYEAEVKGLDEQIQKLGAYDETSQRHLRRAMSDSVKAVARVTRNLAPMGSTGQARAGVDHEVTGGRIFGDLAGRVVDRAYTGLWLEFGTKPHFPPWGAGSGIVQRMGVSAESAFLISRKISMRGTRGQHFMYRAYKASQRAILAYFGDALEKIAKDLVGRRAA